MLDLEIMKHLKGQTSSINTDERIQLTNQVFGFRDGGWYHIVVAFDDLNHSYSEKQNICKWKTETSYHFRKHHLLD